MWDHLLDFLTATLNVVENVPHVPHASSRGKQTFHLWLPLSPPQLSMKHNSSYCQVPILQAQPSLDGSR